MKKTCVICGKEFEAKTKRKVYCSLRCRKKSEIMKRGKMPRKMNRTFVCKNCGKVVTGYFATTQMYCSNHCKKSTCNKRYMNKYKNNNVTIDE